MKIEQIRRIIQQQKSQGKSSQEILAMAKKANLPQAQMLPIILDFFPGFKYDNQKKRDSIQGEFPKIWDPVGQTITETSFASENGKVQKKFEYYKSHPKAIRRNRMWLVLLGILGIGLFGIFWYLNPEFFWLFMLGSGGDDKGSYPLLALPWVPLLLYITYIKRLQKDLIKKIIADKNHWVYSPEKNGNRWSALSQKLPRLFNVGTKKQVLEDEFWGKFTTATQERDFYSGIFHYTVVSGYGKNRKETTHHKTVFSIRLQKVLKHKLLLLPELATDRFWRKLGFNSDIEVESELFNKAFKIYKDGEANHDFLIEVYKKLSPAVQEKLVQLMQENPGSSMVFIGDAFFFVRDGLLFSSQSWWRMKKIAGEPMKTNFFHTVELDPEDEAYLQERFDTLLTIASNVAKYLE